METMRGLNLKGNDTTALNGYLDLKEEITKKINDLEARIKSLVKEDESPYYLKPFQVLVIL